MEAEGISEAGDVVVAGLSCVVRSVYADSDVEAEDEEVEVVAQSDACPEGDVLCQVSDVDGSSGACLVGLHEPDVAGVDEQRAIE